MASNITTWEKQLHEDLPVYGHRNWIVVADAAYPKQSAPGIETINTGADQVEVLEKVLNIIDDMPHVYAAVLVDHELAFVPEEDAPGVSAYREQLDRLLKGKQKEVMPHEEIIDQLDKVSKLFNVLFLKSNMMIPYTTVFLRLECGYWDESQEKRLQEALLK